MSKWERDLSEHVWFLTDVIANLKVINWYFAVYTDGPWYSPWGPLRVHWFDRQTGGWPRGVNVEGERIYILFTPIEVDGVAVDPYVDIGTPERIAFDRTPALLLHQVKSDNWQKAWDQTVAEWEEKGRPVPDFADFLEED